MEIRAAAITAIYLFDVAEHIDLPRLRETLELILFVVGVMK
jgi:hypothetical protein